MSSWTAEPYRAATRVGRLDGDAGDGPGNRLRQAFARLRAEREWRRLYDETVRELSRLGDRELDDIGIGRWQIREVAAQHTRERLGW